MKVVQPVVALAAGVAVRVAVAVAVRGGYFTAGG